MRQFTAIRKNSLPLMLTGPMALVLLAGCGGDDGPSVPAGGGGQNPGQATFTATIDGNVVDFSENAAAFLSHIVRVL